MYAEFLCGTLVTTNQKYKPLEKRTANYFFKNFLNPCGESKEKLKMCAEFFCGTTITASHKIIPQKRNDELFLSKFFNPYCETDKKPKMCAEFLCDAVVTKCHRPTGDCGDLTERHLV